MKKDWNEDTIQSRPWGLWKKQLAADSEWESALILDPQALYLKGTKLYWTSLQQQTWGYTYCLGNNNIGSKLRDKLRFLEFSILPYVSF